MALESVSAVETVIQSNDDNDLEDGEIPSDEDDEPVPVIEPHKATPEPPKVLPAKTESPKHKSFDNKFSKNKKSGSTDKLNRQKGASSDDWAADVEKAIRAALEEDRGKNHDNKSRNKSNKSKNRKRNREEKEEERARDQKRKKLSDEENANEDEDEMLFVRGASPTARKGSHENASPTRRDHDNYSGSDYEDRPANRHRDDNKRGGGRSGRRGLKNDRSGVKNKNRAQLRNERNNRRNQVNDHNQDPDAICVYYMQGKCHRGDDCPFSHNALPPRKMELCKFYLMDCCAKRDKCLYMHHDFPCKYFHTGLKCNAGENCKFSHQSMSDQVKNILLKHLETAPKEILGNFPRLSREGALYLINNTEKVLSQGQDVSNQKIPSLFELKVPTPNENMSTEPAREEGDDQASNKDKNSTTHKDRKSATGKKTRWGSDEDRVPLDMLVQSATQLGLQFSNSQNKTQGGAGSFNFYGEGGPNDITKKEKNPAEKQKKAKENSLNPLSTLPKDVDLRQLLPGVTIPKEPQVVSLAEEAASLTKSKLDDESDRDEEMGLVIEMPTDEEDKDKLASKAQEISENTSNSVDKSKNSSSSTSQEIPANLPKKTQELYLRIQQQQREAEDSFKNLENTENQEISQEDWYSDDDNDDDDDDDDQLTIVLKDIQKEGEEEEENPELKEDLILQPASIPQPAAIVDKLGDLSKIDISMEVSKLLSSIKAQSSNSFKQDKDSVLKAKKEITVPSSHTDITRSSIPEVTTQFSKMVTESSSPKLSPPRTAGTSNPPQTAAVSRDPRMSRDPRQRRDERHSTHSTAATPAVKLSEPKESRPLRLEASIYSSGIIAQDTVMDTDLRAKLDQDHRRKDMDLRCFPPAPSFGDTDLRLVGGHYQIDASKSGDVDLRQMLSLPFKPVPPHVPCVEIEASISSHPPMPYKVYVVDIPRPDYTGLKLTKNDPQVKYDPRLRKIFRLGKDDLADSPMSPPPVKMLDTPKSPPLVRTDPRRKALEGSAHPAPKIIPTTLQQHSVQDHAAIPGMGMSMAPPYMQGPTNMPVPVMQGMGQGMGQGMNQGMGQGMNQGMNQGMGPPPMMMSGNPMMGPNMGPMMRDGPGMGNNGMGPNMRMGNMGPPGPNHQQPHPGPPQNQMNQYDPRYNSQRTTGVGLLGPGPQQMGGYNQDVRPPYDGPPSRYPPDNFNNYGNTPTMDRGDPRGFNPNVPVDEPNFHGNSSDWSSNQSRGNRKDRRRTARGKFGGLPRRKDNASL